MSDGNVSIPRWTPTQRELDDLDLLLAGAFQPPLTGFVDPATAGPAAAVTLHTSRQTAEVAIGVGYLDLMDPEGAPVARMTVESTYGGDSADPSGQVGVAGPVERLAHNEFGPFRRLHLSPADVHAEIAREQLSPVVVDRALSDTDIAAIKDVAAASGKTPLLLACVGHDMPQGISGPALVRAALAAADIIGNGARAVAVSLADHQPGDAATADGSADNDPMSVDEGPASLTGVHAAANRWLAGAVSDAYGDRDVTLPPEPDGEYPEPIAAIVTRDRPPRDSQGVVVFFTGLSGSGKSTLARALVDHVLERGDRTVTSLDGDVVRHLLSKGLGFSREDREANIVRIGFVAAEIARHGGLAVCSPIAPFESTRKQVRQMVERAGGGFVLVHVATPLEECERRDRKGLYAKARAGEIPDFTGISSPYEEPTRAVKLDTTDRQIAECLDELLGVLTTEGWLRP